MDEKNNDEDKYYVLTKDIKSLIDYGKYIQNDTQMDLKHIPNHSYFLKSFKGIDIDALHNTPINYDDEISFSEIEKKIYDTPPNDILFFLKSSTDSDIKSVIIGYNSKKHTYADITEVLENMNTNMNTKENEELFFLKKINFEKFIKYYSIEEQQQPEKINSLQGLENACKAAIKKLYEEISTFRKNNRDYNKLISTNNINGDFLKIQINLNPGDIESNKKFIIIVREMNKYKIKKEKFKESEVYYKDYNQNVLNDMKNELNAKIQYNANRSIITYLKLNDKGLKLSNNYRFGDINIDDNILKIKYNPDQKEFYDKTKKIKYIAVPKDDNEEVTVPDILNTRKYIFGEFTKIFNTDESNEEISNRMEILMDLIIEEKKPVFIIAYGVSGSGKTSTLIKLNSSYEIEGQNGVIPNFCCNICKKEKIQNIKISFKELFALKIQNNHKSIESNEFNFIYNKDLNILVLENDLTIDIIHNYRFKKETLINYNFIKKNGEKIILKKDLNLSDLLAFVIDIDRYVKSTTNNDQSSRSHYLAFINFGMNYGNLIVGDFAGVENIFNCAADTVLESFANIKFQEELFYLNKNNLYNNYYDTIYNGQIENSIHINDNNLLENIVFNSYIYNKEETDKLIKKILNHETQYLNIDGFLDGSDKNNNLKTMVSAEIQKYFGYYLNIMKKIFDIKKFVMPINNEDEKILKKDKKDRELKIQNCINEMEKKKNIIYSRLGIDINEYKDLNESSFFEKMIEIIKARYNETIFSAVFDWYTYQKKDLKTKIEKDGVYNRLLLLYHKEKPVLNIYDDYIENYNNLIRYSNQQKKNDITVDDLINGYLTDFKNKSISMDGCKEFNKLIKIYNERTNKETPLIPDIVCEDLTIFFKYQEKKDDIIENFIHIIIRNYLLNKSCLNRVKEGTYINSTLSKLRESINKIINTKFYNFYNYLDDCYQQYNITHDEIIYTDNKTDIDNENYIIKAIQEKKININDMTICIFNLFNISPYENNPPNIPYIDLFDYVKAEDEDEDEAENTKKINKEKLSETLLYYQSNNILVYDTLLEKINDDDNDAYIINYIENLNASTTIGTIEYLDRISKSNNISRICRGQIEIDR